MARSGPRKGIVELVHLRFMGGPVGLGVGHDLVAGETRHVVRVDDLDVGDVRAGVVRAVGQPRRGHRVERLADRPLADGVGMRLEAGRADGDHGVAQRLGMDQARAAFRGRATGRVEIRVEDGRR